ncbi:hypothetical protein [uncultured Desulfobacter sp.]|uniref:hypothetical protein n=1 Tax=uncultured Desulfobacter sp. TaxID=240139 RepID=UPI002AAB6E08|nr:hypothetical protein [uncultured Desulfobacter sp.]
MDAQIIYSKKISFQQANTLSPQLMKERFHGAMGINNILEAQNKRIAYFFIDPLLHSFEAANCFYFGILECNIIKKINTYKTGAGPIQAITDAVELIRNGLYDAVFIFGHDPLLSDTKNYGKEIIKKAMEIFEDCSLIQCYDLLARQLCRETGISDDQFRKLSDDLFNNYLNTFQNRSGARLNLSRGKILRDLGSDLFCLTDCANPNIDFAGGLIVANNCTAEQLNIPKDRWVKVLGSQCSMVKGSPKEIHSITGKGTDLFPHLKEAFQSVQTESRIDIIQEFQNKNLLLEAYTCYPPIPMALLLTEGFIGSIHEVSDFLQHHQITVTGGMNIARAPWNNPALNGLIEVTEQLVKDSHAKYGMVHGNGGIGEAQGITILERPLG